MHKEDVVLDKSGKIDVGKYLNYYEQLLDYDIKSSLLVVFALSELN